MEWMTTTSTTGTWPCLRSDTPPPHTPFSLRHPLLSGGFKPFPSPCPLLAGGDGHSAEGVVSAQPSGQLHQPHAGGQGTRGGGEHWREEETEQGFTRIILINQQ